MSFYTPRESLFHSMVESPFHALDGELPGSLSVVGTSFWDIANNIWNPSSRNHVWDGTIGYPFVTVYKLTDTGLPDYLTLPGAVQCDGISGSITWGISSGSLPPGLSLSTLSAYVVQIIGTPTAAGTFTFTLSAYVGAVIVGSMDASLRIYAPPTVSNLTDLNTFISPSTTDGKLISVSVPDGHPTQNLNGFTLLNVVPGSNYFSGMAYPAATPGFAHGSLILIAQTTTLLNPTPTYRFYYDITGANIWEKSSSPSLYTGTYHAVAGGGPDLTIV